VTDINKKAVIGGLEMIESHFENVHILTINPDCLQWIIEIGIFKENIKKSIRPFLTENEINDFISKVTFRTACWNSNLKKQLTEYWKFRKYVNEAWIKQGTRPFSENFSILGTRENQDLSHKTVFDQNQILRNIKGKPNSNDIRAILINFSDLVQSRFFTHEEEFEKFTKEKCLENQYDVKEIFSINGKIRHNDKFETDVRVIRNCIGHARYEIIEKDGSFEIKFWSGDKIFKKIFSENDFYKFMQDVWMLLDSQRVLSCVSFLAIFLAKFFKK